VARSPSERCRSAAFDQGIASQFAVAIERVAIVTLKNHTPNPILRLFKDAARAVMKSLDLGTTRRARHRASA